MKTFIATALSFVVLTATSQELPKRTPLHVFATYEDMVADKPVEGVQLDPQDHYGYHNKKEWIFVLEAGAPKKVVLGEVSYWGYTDPDGSVQRIFEGQAYKCYALGNNCYYQGRPNINPESGNAYMRDWISEGPNGAITDGKRIAEDVIEAAGQKKEYDEAKPKREMKDSVEDYQAKLYDRIVVFFDRINGDSAVK